MAHNHVHHYNSSSNLKLAFFLNLAFTIFELFGGVYVNSVSIISDAIHDLGDSLSLGTAWFLDHKSKKDSNNQYTYGYARFSLLSALINSIVLIAGSVYVIYEAVNRLFYPELSDAKGMFFFALFGIAVNGYAAWKVSSGKSLNEKVISWHLLEDVLGWVAILIASVILYFYESPYIDPALSLLITLYILWNVISRLKETLFLFLQGTPPDIDVIDIQNKIKSISHVENVHHTHIWSLEGEHHVFTTHVLLKNVNSMDQIDSTKKEIISTLKPYHFTHITLETELDPNNCSLA